MKSRIRAILSVTLITALLLGSTLYFGEQPATASDGKVVDLPPIESPEEGNPKLDSRLSQLVSAEKRGQASAFAQKSNIELVNDKVRVVIESKRGRTNDTSDAAKALGAKVETSYRNLVQVAVPIPALTALSDTPSVRFVRLPYRPLPAVTSEGVGLMNADGWQTAGYTGTGVKVAILDVGFQGYLDLLGTELPSSVVAKSYRQDEDIEAGEVHGTACAEIIYDIAPDADFYLVNYETEAEMGNAVNWLIGEGVDVISHSIGWLPGGPGDGTGVICEIVDNARAGGILWSQSVGNYGQQHWQGDFVDTTGDGWHEFDPGIDESQGFLWFEGLPILASLRWDDDWGSSGNNYDLHLFFQDLFDPEIFFEIESAASENIQDGDDEPWEELEYEAEYTGIYHIAIAKVGSPDVVNFHLHTPGIDLQYQVAAGSFAIPADSPSAMSVGAVFWHNPIQLESFSSQGPTDDGRIKPDLVAFDGVSTVTYGASDGVPYEDLGTGFFGTSASAPHGAGAAAFVKECYPLYTPAQIQAFLEGRALELGATGKDNLYGSGGLVLDTPPPTWDSYRGGYPDDSGVQEDYFDDYDTEHIVYMYGTVFAPGTYNVIYWDGAGNKRVVDNITVLADQKLKSQWTLDPDKATEGDWHVAVYTQDSDPQSYPAADAYLIADDASYNGGYAFHVEGSAIPEFPTVLAAIVALALCAGIYLRMRRRAVRKSA